MLFKIQKLSQTSLILVIIVASFLSLPILGHIRAHSISDNNNLNSNKENNRKYNDYSNNLIKEYHEDEIRLKDELHSLNENRINRNNMQHSTTINSDLINNNKINGENGSGILGTILVNETLNFEVDNNLDLSNSWNGIQINNSISIQNLPGYTNSSGKFSIENITAKSNYVIIENITGASTSSSKNGNPEAVATSFTIDETLINISSVQVAYETFNAATGEFFITGVTNGVPNGTIFGESLSLTLNDNPQNENEYLVILNYSVPLTLPAGTYAIVLNDTDIFGPDSNYFRFSQVGDFIDSEGNESQSWEFEDGANSWTIFDVDLPFKYNFIALNPNNVSEPKIYTSPISLNLSYNNSLLSALNNNILFLNGSIAFFESNISVTFDITYNIFMTSTLNSISAPISYIAENNTSPLWNTSFTQNMISSGAYRIKNRTFLLFSIPVEWTANSIYRDNMLIVSNPESNASVIYSAGDSILILNVSSDLNSHDWIIEYSSPNSLQNIFVTVNELEIQSANTNDTLEIKATLPGMSGLNGTIKVFDPSSSLIYNETNISVSNNYLNFSLWSIIDSINPNLNVSGEYTISIIWFDDTGTKIGYREIRIEVFTATNLIDLSVTSTIQYNDTLPLNIEYSNLHNGTNLNDAELTFNTSWGDAGILTQSISHGDYEVGLSTFNASIGMASVIITANLTNFINKSIKINMTITGISTVIQYQINKTTSITKDVIHLDVLYIDTTNSNNLTSALLTVNGTTPISELNNIYTFHYDISSVNPSIFQIKFEIIAVKDKFETIQQFITVNRTKNTDFDFTTNNVLANSTSVTYQRSSLIGIIWNNLQDVEQILNASISVNNSEWIEFINNTIDIYYFEIYGLKTSGISIEINFKSPLYTLQTLILHIDVQNLLTDQLEEKFTKGILVSSGTSKLGYTLGLELTWKITDNQTIIRNVNWEFSINNLLITDLSKFGTLIFVNSTQLDPWSLKLDIWFSPNNNFTKGLYEFTVSLSSTGLESKSFTFFIQLDGFDINLNIDYPETLVQGDAFIITARVSYSIGNLTDQFSLLDLINNQFQIFSSSNKIYQNPDIPIAQGLSVIFVIEIEYNNNSLATISIFKVTDINGEASYTIPGEITKEISLLPSITVMLNSNSLGDSFQVKVITIDVIEIILSNPLIDPTTGILIAVLVTILIILLLFSITFVYRKKRDLKKFQSNFAKNNLDFISNLALLIVTTDAGLPVYTLSQSKFLDNPNISDLIGGHASGLDMFLETFQSDFLSNVLKNGIDKNDNWSSKSVRFSTIEQDELKISLCASKSYRILVLSFNTMPKFMQQRFINIIKNLEKKVIISSGIINRTILAPKIEKEIRNYFPITLLKTFIINVGQLRYIEQGLTDKKNINLSKKAIDALKFLSLIQSISINSIPTDKDSQLKLYDQLIKEQKLPGDRIIPMFFDEAINLLVGMNQVPYNTIYEAFWKASNQEVLIIIPYEHQE